MRTPTHYDILEIKETASAEVVKGAYRFLSQKYHPDKNPANPAEAEAVFKRLNEAYSVLANPEKRRQYDRQLQLAGLFQPQAANPFTAAEPNRDAQPPPEAAAKKPSPSPKKPTDGSSPAEDSSPAEGSPQVDDSAAFDATAAAIRAIFAKQKADAAQRAALRAAEKQAQQAKRNQKFKRLAILILLGLLAFYLI